jgi:hypothetical protein
MQRRLTAILSADVAYKTDPDLDRIRDHPRFKAMLASAKARLVKSS